MSGRTMVDLPDGRRVRGYRKTMRRQGPPRQATQAHEAPELRLTFLVPTPLALTTTDGLWAPDVLVDGLRVVVRAKTFNRRQVLARCAEFLRRNTAASLPPYTVAAVLTSSSEPGWSVTYQVTHTDGDVIAALTPYTPLVFPAVA